MPPQAPPVRDLNETRKPNSRDLSTRRVQSYTPDNVFVRLSCGAPNLQASTKDREYAMKAIVDNLAKVIEGKRE